MGSTIRRQALNVIVHKSPYFTYSIHPTSALVRVNNGKLFTLCLEEIEDVPDLPNETEVSCLFASLIRPKL